MGRLADALFPSIQQRLLALLFLHPERSYRTAELITLARGGTGGTHRCLVRLAAAGWLTVERVGNQKHYRSNPDCPAFAELRALVERTLEAPRARPALAAKRSAAREDTPTAEAAPPQDGWRSW